MLHLISQKSFRFVPLLNTLPMYHIALKKIEVREIGLLCLSLNILRSRTYRRPIRQDYLLLFLLRSNTHNLKPTNFEVDNSVAFSIFKMLHYCYFRRIAKRSYPLKEKPVHIKQSFLIPSPFQPRAAPESASISEYLPLPNVSYACSHLVYSPCVWFP